METSDKHDSTEEIIQLTPKSVKRVTDKLFKSGQIRALQVLKIKRLLETDGAEAAQKELQNAIHINGLRGNQKEL